MGNSSWRGTMPNTAAQVAELQDKASVLQNKYGFYESNAFENIIMRLEVLKDAVEQNENAFFASFNISKGRAGMEELQRRLDIMNSDPGFRSMSNVADSEFDKLVALGLSGIDLSQPIQLTFQEEPEALNSLGVEPTIDEFINAIEQIRNPQLEIKTSRINKSSKKGEGARGLTKYLGSIKINPNNKKEVKLELVEPMPPSWQRRLVANTQAALDRGTTREQVIRKWLMEKISNAEIKRYVEYQFDINAHKYDLNGSSASVKGFLGEVRTAAFLDCLAGGVGQANPTGNLRELVDNKTGGEIPIDTILRNAGFQVKNYRIIDGKVDFSTHNQTMSMKNFLIERVRPEPGVLELLLDFYGSWGFNMPIDGSKGEEYQQIYSRFEGKDFTSFYEGHIDNILRLSDEFQTKAGRFAEKSLYFNSFFMIADKIIPSSSILSAMINQMRAKKNNYASGSFTIIPPQKISPVWQQGEGQDETSETPENLAARTKISYSIQLNIEEILLQAYNEAQQI